MEGVVPGGDGEIGVVPGGEGVLGGNAGGSGDIGVVPGGDGEVGETAGGCGDTGVVPGGVGEIGVVPGGDGVLGDTAGGDGVIGVVPGGDGEVGDPPGVGGEEGDPPGGDGKGKEGLKTLHPNDLQSTGLDKNDAHSTRVFWNGLAGKQFLLSSDAGKPKHAGGSPVKKLSENVKFLRLGNIQILDGILPDNILCATLSSSKLTAPPIAAGKGPTN